MKVYKEETEGGVLKTLTLRRDEEETTEQFRVNAKNWIKVAYPMTWEKFVDRLVTLESDRIVLDMK